MNHGGTGSSPSSKDRSPYDVQRERIAWLLEDTYNTSNRLISRLRPVLTDMESGKDEAEAPDREGVLGDLDHIHRSVNELLKNLLYIEENIVL